MGGGKSVWFQFRAHYKVSLLLDSKGKTHRLVMTLPFLATAVTLEGRKGNAQHSTAWHEQGGKSWQQPFGSTKNPPKRQNVVFVNFRDKNEIFVNFRDT